MTAADSPTNPYLRITLPDFSSDASGATINISPIAIRFNYKRAVQYDDGNNSGVGIPKVQFQCFGMLWLCPEVPCPQCLWWGWILDCSCAIIEAIKPETSRKDVLVWRRHKQHHRLFFFEYLCRCRSNNSSQASPLDQFPRCLQITASRDEDRSDPPGAWRSGNASGQ